MKTIRFIFGLFFLFSFNSSFAKKAEKWEWSLRTKENGIVVYEREFKDLSPVFSIYDFMNGEQGVKKYVHHLNKEFKVKISKSLQGLNSFISQKNFYNLLKKEYPSLKYSSNFYFYDLKKLDKEIKAGSNVKEKIQRANKIRLRQKVAHDSLKSPNFFFDEFKAIATIDAPVQTVFNVIYDIPSQKEWMGDNKGSCIKKIFSDTHMLGYNILSATVPFTNRDLVIDVHFNKVDKNFKKGIVVTMDAETSSTVPEVDDYVRITKFHATCYLERIGKNKTKIIYQNRVDPNLPFMSFIPRSTANWIVRNNPIVTIKGIKKMVKKAKYQKQLTFEKIKKGNKCP